jgi:uncharacterized protein (DUF1015 family)
VIVRPFTGRLVSPAWAERVVAPMSDGLAGPERARLTASGDSFLGVTRPVPSDLTGEEVSDWLAANRAALADLLVRGAFRPDTGSRLLVYRMHVSDRQHTGLVVEVSASAFAERRVRGHESVHAERVNNLVRQFEAVPAQAEMVALLHEYDDYVEQLIEATLAVTPVLAFRDVSGVDQEVWEVTDPATVAATCAHLSGLGLYIADGHHRVAAAVRRWELSGRHPGETVLAVAYPAHQLHLLAFHRFLAGPVDSAALLAAARSVGAVARANEAQFRAGAVGVYVAGEWWTITFPPSKLLGAAALDASRLHHDLLEPLVGWELGARLEMVPELVGLDALVGRADAEAGALFALAPPTIPELMSVADRGEVMLPKSTFFDPKPRGGLVLLGDV